MLKIAAMARPSFQMGSAEEARQRARPEHKAVVRASVGAASTTGPQRSPGAAPSRVPQLIKILGEPFVARAAHDEELDAFWW